MEIEAIRVGLDLHYFWNITPKQFEKHIKVFNEREKNRIVEKDMLNYLLGKYVSIGFNDPKHYPKKGFLFEDKSDEIMSDEEMEKMAKRNTIKMGGVISDNR